MDPLTAIEEAPNFHGRVMNIGMHLSKAMPGAKNRAYIEGHRDARHAAAEIANEADARIAALIARLREAEANAAAWHALYRRAVNEANELTNYVEDRPELRRADRRLTEIENDAKALKESTK